MSNKGVFMIGDTVKTGREQKVHSGFVDGFPTVDVVIPAASRALIGLIVNGRIAGEPVDMYRLYFGFKDRGADLWCVDEWIVLSCRAVLTEKTLPLSFGDEEQILEYRNS